MALIQSDQVQVNIKSEATIRAIYGNNPRLNASATTGQPTQTGTVVTFNYTNYVTDGLAGDFSATDDSKLFINWGDTTSNYDQRFDGNNQEITHTYTSAGTYTISAYMRDPKGNQSETEEFTITTVAWVAPTEIKYCGDPDADNYQDPNQLAADNPTATLIKDDSTCEYTTTVDPTWVLCGNPPIVQNGDPPATGYRYVSDGQGGFCWDPIAEVVVEHKTTNSTTSTWQSFDNKKLLFMFQRGATGISIDPIEVKITTRNNVITAKKVTVSTSDLFRLAEGSNPTSLEGKSNTLNFTIPAAQIRTFLIDINPDKKGTFGDGITEFNIRIEIEDL